MSPGIWFLIAISSWEWSQDGGQKSQDYMVLHVSGKRRMALPWIPNSHSASRPDWNSSFSIVVAWAVKCIHWVNLSHPCSESGTGTGLSFLWNTWIFTWKSGIAGKGVGELWKENKSSFSPDLTFSVCIFCPSGEASWLWAWKEILPVGPHAWNFLLPLNFAPIITLTGNHPIMS